MTDAHVGSEGGPQEALGPAPPVTDDRDPQTPGAPGEAHPEGSGEAPAGTESILTTGDWRRLDPGWIPAERVSWLIMLGVLALGGPAMLVVVLHTRIVWMLAACAGCLFVALLAWWAATAWIRRAEAITRWRVTEGALTIRRGVFWRTLTTVPRTRIQHTDVTQGPLQRRYGIATLVVHTAGTSEATVSLPGLAYDLAHQVRDHLLVVGGDDAV